MVNASWKNVMAMHIITTEAANWTRRATAAATAPPAQPMPVVSTKSAFATRIFTIITERANRTVHIIVVPMTTNVQVIVVATQQQGNAYARPEDIGITENVKPIPSQTVGLMETPAQQSNMEQENV